jgi:quinol monooxygenase YgiN
VTVGTVLILERYPVDPAQLDRFGELASARVERLRRAGGNLWADLSRAGDDEPSYLLLSEWRSQSDADAADDDGHSFDPVLRGEVTRRRFPSTR